MIANSRLVLYNLLASAIVYAEILLLTRAVPYHPLFSVFALDAMVLLFLLFSTVILFSKNVACNKEPDLRFALAHLAACAAFAAYYFFLERGGALGPLTSRAAPLFAKAFHVHEYAVVIRMNYLCSVPVIALAHFTLCRVFFSGDRLFRKHAAVAILASLPGRFFYPPPLWMLLCGSVAWSLAALLGWTGLYPVYSHPAGQLPSVGTDQFSIVVHSRCSGIEGMTTFLIAFAVMAVLNRKTLDVKRALAAMIAGTGIMYIANVLRIYILILIGHSFGERYAVDLWHTQGSLIFYTIVIIVLLNILRDCINKP